MSQRSVMQVVVAAAALLALPLAVDARDIGWKYTYETGSFLGGGKVARQGPVQLATGEKGEIKYEGTNIATDEKGRNVFVGDIVMKFEDGSTITGRQNGTADPKTLESTGAGEFTGGTGKYAGIAGTYTYSGLTLKAEARGTYELGK
ncbi:MAG: hypothetical protein ACM3SO_00250 [Betaproteobacteria bacterium]